MKPAVGVSNPLRLVAILLSVLSVFTAAGCSDKQADARSAEVATSEFPQEYRGEWVTEMGLCGFEGDDLDRRFFIFADRAGFFESHHRVKSISQGGEGLVIEYFVNPDTSILGPERMYLSPDGQQLRLDDAPESAAYLRCPGI